MVKLFILYKSIRIFIWIASTQYHILSRSFENYVRKLIQQVFLFNDLVTLRQGKSHWSSYREVKVNSACKHSRHERTGWKVCSAHNLKCYVSKSFTMKDKRTCRTIYYSYRSKLHTQSKVQADRRVQTSFLSCQTESTLRTQWSRDSNLNNIVLAEKAKMAHSKSNVCCERIQAHARQLAPLSSYRDVQYCLA